jgi:ferric-dicitrate binding protein FerR (iron transport regulator)
MMDEAQRAADKPAEAQRRRNLRLLALLLGVVGGLLLASVAFVALRN